MLLCLQNNVLKTNCPVYFFVNPYSVLPWTLSKFNFLGARRWQGGKIANIILLDVSTSKQVHLQKKSLMYALALEVLYFKPPAPPPHCCQCLGPTFPGFPAQGPRAQCLECNFYMELHTQHSTPIL